MPGKVWTPQEIETLKTLYLDEGLTPGECAKRLRTRTKGQIQYKVSALGWGKIKKLSSGEQKKLLEAPLAKDNETALAKSKGKALTRQHLEEVAERTVGMVGMALDLGEAAAGKGLKGVYEFHEAVKVAERLGNMHRKAVGLDVPGGLGGNTFNLYFGADPARQPRKVEEV